MILYKDLDKSYSIHKYKNRVSPKLIYKNPKVGRLQEMALGHDHDLQTEGSEVDSCCSGDTEI